MLSSMLRKTEFKDMKMKFLFHYLLSKFWNLGGCGTITFLCFMLSLSCRRISSVFCFCPLRLFFNWAECFCRESAKPMWLCLLPILSMNSILYFSAIDRTLLPIILFSVFHKCFVSLSQVLLKRSGTKEGAFTHAPTGAFDHDLFTLIWGPTVAALSFVFDKSSDDAIIAKAISGFR